MLDASGHVTLAWDPDDPASAGRALAEFERLKAAGFCFFVTGGAAEVTRLKPGALAQTGQLEVHMGQTREFKPRARRAVAVPPMRGG